MSKRKKPAAEASEDETSAKGLLPRKRRKLSPGSGYEGPEVSLSDFSLEASYEDIPSALTGNIDGGALGGVASAVDASFDTSHKQDHMWILTDTSGEGASCDKSHNRHLPETIRGPCSSVSVSNSNMLSPIASKSGVSFTVSPNQSSSSNSFTFYPQAPTASTPGITFVS